jgi:uncharacterized protein YdeI (YjbR/CyaY-like superfamily)
MNPQVDFFFEEPSQWQKEYKKLRTIVLGCGLTEELKWGVPCYTYENSNVVLIHGFKEYCALLFHKGALLKDTNDILIQQTKNVQAARQVRFTNVQEIEKLKPVLKSLIYQAIEVEKAGLKINFKKTEEFEMSPEFQKRLDKNKTLKSAFENLTPGRQKGYLLYFSQAKQTKTRESRIDKSVDKILKGQGLND